MSATTYQRVYMYIYADLLPVLPAQRSWGFTSFPILISPVQESSAMGFKHLQLFLFRQLNEESLKELMHSLTPAVLYMAQSLVFHLYH